MSMEREERLRRRRELYGLRRSTETPEQRESRLAAQRERERRRLFSNYCTCIDNSSLTTIQRGRLREKAFAGTLIFLVGQLELLRLTLRCSNICLVIWRACHSIDIDFDNKSGNYWPVLYLNDYWNLARDYQPVNDTTK